MLLGIYILAGISVEPYLEGPSKRGKDVPVTTTITMI
jgi:hypothetical protein